MSAPTPTPRLGARPSSQLPAAATGCSSPPKSLSSRSRSSPSYPGVCGGWPPRTSAP